MRISTLLVPSFVLLSGISSAQSLPSLSVAGSAGVFFPRSSEIQNLFGARQFSLGLQPWGGNSTQSGFSPEISLIDGADNGNKFLVVPLAYAYEWDFTQGTAATKSPATPYLRASAGAAYFDYSITRESGNHYGLKRVGGTLGLEAGLKLSSSAKAYVKYDLFSVEQHFDFSGVQIGMVISLGHV